MAKKDINFSTYVERDLTKSVIDWGTISKTLSDDLVKLKEERDTKRAEIAKSTTEAENTLNTLEQYDNADLGTLALGMSNESAEFLRVQNDLFKRGLITQTEFAQAKQRVLADWKQFSNVSKQWNTDYAEYVKRIDDGEASNLEQWLNDQNVAFGNLQNIQGYVNPQSGRLSLVEVDPATGEPSNDPGKHVSMNTINTRFKTQYTKIDPIQYVKGTVTELGALLREKLGPNQQVYGEKGWGTMKDDVGFQQQMRDQVKGLLSDKAVATLAGSPSIGAKYTYNKDEITADTEDKVLMKLVNGRPVIDREAENFDKVEKKVEDLLYGQAMMQMNEEYTVEKGFEISTDLAEKRVKGQIDSQEYRDELAGAKQKLDEKKQLLAEKVAAGNMTAQEESTALARDRYELDVLKYETNDGLVNAQIDQISANINLNRDKFNLAKLTGDRNYKIALMNETYKSKLLKEKEEEGIVPFTYPDPNKTSQFGGVDMTGAEFIKDEVDKTIQLNPVWWSPENTADLSATVGKYIEGMLDTNVYNELAQNGGFDVRWKKGKGGKDSQAGGMVITVGGVDYDYPPKPASDFEINSLMKEDPNLTRDEVVKQINDANGYNEFTAKGFKAGAGGRGGVGTTSVPSDVFFGWINKFVLDPATTGAIALQDPPEAPEANYIETISKSGAGNVIFNKPVETEVETEVEIKEETEE